MNMTQIIGRKKEIELIDNYLQSTKAEFLVVCGRRRIGKTFLIKQFFNNRFTFYMSGAENATKTQQLFNFTIALREYSNTPYPPVSSWQEAFVQLKHFFSNIETDQKMIVFFDELPWLDNAKSGFLPAF
jgi:hypothetical protein